MDDSGLAMKSCRVDSCLTKEGRDCLGDVLASLCISLCRAGRFFLALSIIILGSACQTSDSGDGTDVNDSEDRSVVADPDSTPTSASTPEDQVQSDRVLQIIYRTAWDLEGLVSAEGADSEDSASKIWSTINDLGFQIEVEEAYLVSHSAQLSECESETGLLERILRPARAHAGHGDNYNSSALLVSKVEAIQARSEPQRWGETQVQDRGQSYCSSFFLVAMAGPQALDLPQEVDMVGYSSYVRGRYRMPASDESESTSTSDEGVSSTADWQEFQIHSKQANGRLDSLASPIQVGERRSDALDEAGCGGKCDLKPCPDRASPDHAFIRRDGLCVDERGGD